MTAGTAYLSGSSAVVPIELKGDRILLLDQRFIPERVEHFDATELEQMCFALEHMVIRGAPSIGAAAALALAYEARRLSHGQVEQMQFLSQLEAACRQLQATRPTAVNLFSDTNRLIDTAHRLQSTPLPVDKVADRLIELAKEILAGYVESCRLIGEYGANLVEPGANLITHCNSGALACCGWGTALGIIRAAHLRGNKVQVYVDETRPRQQGARLTTWELLQDGISPILITDSMAGYLMSKMKTGMVVVGADRIALNGDVANKIGTYSLAVLATAHNIPFYVAAPLSSFDAAMSTGDGIPIEHRNTHEVVEINEKRICPPQIQCLNPAFDITPFKLVTALVTEVGILRPPFQRSIRQALASRSF